IAAATIASEPGAAQLSTGASRATGYTSVYILEILLLLAGLAAIGPLVGRERRSTIANKEGAAEPFGLREFPT
ncbi:MAG: MFS transporter, partial [Pseudomonadota bacterium]